MSDTIPGKESRRRGRPSLSDPLKNTIAIQVTRAMLDALPKNAKGNPDQDWIREALQARIEGEGT